MIEQLLYEIGDPAHYLTPDVDVDFTTVEVEQAGRRSRGGHAAPPGGRRRTSYKVSLAYRAGFTASGQLLVCGRDCVAKAQACGQMILDRVRQAGFELDDSLVECLGAGRSAPGFRSRRATCAKSCCASACAIGGAKRSNDSPRNLPR